MQKMIKFDDVTKENTKSKLVANSWLSVQNVNN